VVERPGSCAGAARDANLVEDIADVPGDGLLADEQLLGDGAIRLAGRNEAQDLQFPFAERAWSVMQSVSRRLLDSREARIGFQLHEQPPRGIQIELMAIVIPPSFTYGGHQQTCLRFFVGDVEIAPGFARLAERRRRGGELAFGQQDRARGVRGYGRQKRRADGAGDTTQLRSGSARAFGISGSKQYLDSSGKNSCARRSCRRVYECAPD
jgi:hypothetical protein